MGAQNKPQNDDFSKNYNMAQHNQKMAAIGNRYAEHNINYSKNIGFKAQTTQESYIKVDRKTALYKPSIDIQLTNESINIKFQYDSAVQSRLKLYIGVNNILQDNEQHKTTNIEADILIQQVLPAGKKQKFQKTHNNLNGKHLADKQIVLRVQNMQESTEYSLRRTNKSKQQVWKIILQKYQKDDKTYQLENIYGAGGDDQDCIVCLTEKSNTIVKPCNHLCLCKDCSKHINNKTRKCPICRKDISKLVTIGVGDQS